MQIMDLENYEISDIDIVAIITPSGMHFEHSLDVLKKYNKHIIVEKPTFMKPSQLNEVYSVADNLGLKIPLQLCLLFSRA